MGLLMMISGGILMVLVAKLITKVVRWLVNAITVILPIICWIGVMMFLVVVEPAGSLWFIVVSCAPFALYVGIIATIRMARLAMKEFMSIVKSKPSFLLGAVARADRFVRSGLWPVNLVLFSRSIATKPRADISTSQTPREETTSRVRFQPMVEVLRYWPEDIIRPPSERMVRAGSSEKSTKVQWNIFQQARFSPAFNKKMLARRKRRGKKRL
ncbi:hypothetical protein AAMO2058_001468200 [Amorphochlora amoebiformis]|uniref:Uncharacterized protein n=1 Tax=Amorphochlora amoebiformis TaxID=1561963 RepID=A0A7S0DP14_9EUKA|mmetsp:Transcript_4217/g.6406  ORF Transcript_4217/g.6406 Transcript_4217/m.6406 type:complete len:213 (+) Transcript_4217:158-796(+)